VHIADILTHNVADAGGWLGVGWLVANIVAN